jgi:hypothetical protein
MMQGKQTKPNGNVPPAAAAGDGSALVWRWAGIGGWLLVRLILPLLLLNDFFKVAEVGDLTSSWAADVLLLVGSGLWLLDGVKASGQRLLAWLAADGEMPVAEAQTAAHGGIVIIHLEDLEDRVAGDPPRSAGKWPGANGHSRSGRDG